MKCSAIKKTNPVKGDSKIKLAKYAIGIVDKMKVVMRIYTRNRLSPKYWRSGKNVNGRKAR